MNPKGRVAMLTGGARGGQAVAQALAARGCALALTYRHSRDAAEAAASAARAAGVQSVLIRADTTDEAQIESAVSEAAKTLGGLDILLNMASSYVKTPAPSAADWNSAMDANARGAFLFSTLAAPIMKERGGGRIINISDWLPASGRPRYKGYTPYYASKAALI